MNIAQTNQPHEESDHDDWMWVEPEIVYDRAGQPIFCYSPKERAEALARVAVENDRT